MIDVSGDFEMHLTAEGHEAEALASFAAANDLKFVHVLLDGGVQPSQPMLTVRGTGDREHQHAVLRTWWTRLEAIGIRPLRTKIELSPTSTGVPDTDVDSAAEPPDRYFEHHVKVLLPDPTLANVLAVTEVAERHGARLSRVARRHRPDGAEERFVNQRCRGVGRVTASQGLDRLVADLRAAGHEVVQVEQEYVVHDSNLDLDRGWLLAGPPPATQVYGNNVGRSAPAASPDLPATYRPLPLIVGVTQRAAFDPALKQHSTALRAGEPDFLDPAAGRRWRDARRAAMHHLLTVIAASEWGGQLVLRGSVTMAAWAPMAARDPGDLDFVVTPPTIDSASPQARALLKGIAAAMAAAPGAGLRPEHTTQSAIWTYERADGRRLVVPFSAPGVPDGVVQIDIVFGEHLPVPPEPLTLPGMAEPVLAATAGLSLAWKLMWLAGDTYPQGKDLYDAVLLAEYTTVDLTLVRELLRPELGGEAGDFTAESVLSWHDVDWDNFVDEYPRVGGTPEQWLRRLASALDRGFREGER